jgi:hypothetical protein
LERILPDYSVWILEAGDITISGGRSLSGITQGDGSHLLGQTIRLESNDWHETRISDSDSSFEDSDGTQRLNGAQTIGGVTYANGTVVEAEYRLTLTNPLTGDTWEVLAYNVNNSTPAYGTVEGLAFVGPVGGFPPRGVDLAVTATYEGPSYQATDLASPPCFVTGTLILTPAGWRPIEDLAVGDLVLTRDNGPQSIRWVGAVRLDARRLARRPEFRPLCIRRGAFGVETPARDLRLSPQHRILLSGPRLMMHFGEDEMLCAARHLVDGLRVRVDDAKDGVVYHHILFDTHEIVMAEGLWTESFLPGPESVDAISEASRTELLALFPELADGLPGPLKAARPILRGFEAALVA